MNKYLKFGSIAIFLLFFITIISHAALILDDSICAGYNFQKAAFRIWVPDDEKYIRAVIVMVPGSNADGRDLIYSEAWQSLARKYQCALLGCCYTDNPHKRMEIEEYVNVREGSGEALLNTLQKFSLRSGHPELEDAPLALWGMSAGGEFNYEFLCWKPQRVVCFVVNKGGIYYSALAPENARDVPGIFFNGETDSPYRTNIVKGIFSINRRFGAKWMYIEEPGTGHEFKESEKFAISYFDVVIPLRLPDNQILSYPLKDSGNQGLVLNLTTGEVITKPEDTNFDILTSWIPDYKIFQQLQNWMKEK
jgi:hypothetical protein